MTQEPIPQHVSRRRFLQGAAVTAAAAAATGAGAALLKESAAAPAATTVQSAPLVQSVQTAVTDFAAHPDDLIARLAAAQADNLRLQAALTAAERQLAAMQAEDATQSGAAEALTVELADANTRVSVLTGLMALYEQLAAVDVGDTVEAGAAAVSEAIANLLDDAPALEEGVTLAAAALDNFEAQLPVLQNGRFWLKTQTEKLQQYFLAIEKLLEKTASRVAPLLEMIQAWFADVRKWLPFGIGEQAAEVVQSLTTLIDETPRTIAGLATNIAEPLDVWLHDDGDDLPIQRNLVKPIREQVLTKTNQTVGKARQLNDVYQSQLAEPAQAAMARRQTLQTLIAEYRDQHQL